MSVLTQNTFQPDAFEANRRGELSERQLQGLRALSRSRRRSALGSAAYFVAGAVLVGFFASASAPVVTRTLITFACVAIAAFLVVRSVTGSDALTRDLRNGQVQSVEGAIGRRRMGSGRRTPNYYLEVGKTRFKVSRSTYEAAPDAGFVRLFYLPRSRKFVNLERLPDAPVPDARTAQALLDSARPMFRSSSRTERNEARAELAGLMDAFDASTAPAATGPPHNQDPRPLDEAIVGTWTNVLMSVTFSSGGRLTIQLPGETRNARWSVDRDGRLTADLSGASGRETVDAWVAGDQLTINLDGQSLTFTRQSRG
jgi:hypothetical protein